MPTFRQLALRVIAESGLEGNTMLRVTDSLSCKTDKNLSTTIERFMSNIVFPEDAINGCWNWKGSFFLSGYPKFYTGDGYKSAIRVSHELFVGPLEPFQLPDHLCERIRCVRFTHLECVTYSENLIRYWNMHPHIYCSNGHWLSPRNIEIRGQQRNCKMCRELGRKLEKSIFGPRKLLRFRSAIWRCQHSGNLR
jgi:hypothetical protein